MAETIRSEVAHNVVNTNRRATIGHFLSNLRKFAVDSAVNASLKGFTGGGKKLYEIFLQERFKDDQPSRKKLEDEKQMMEDEMQLAKMQGMNEVKQQSKTATTSKVVRESKPVNDNKKKMPQGLKEMELQDPNRKRIFIRSRL